MDLLNGRADNLSLVAATKAAPPPAGVTARTSATQAVAEALAWARTTRMTVPGVLSVEQLAELQAVFSGTKPWSPALYHPLRVFAYAYYRSRLGAAPSPPPLTLGDVFSALDAVGELQTGDAPVWTATGTPSLESLAALGFMDSSVGISRTRDENRAGWDEHGRLNQRLVAQAAARLPGECAAVIGAGKAYDLPLRELAMRYRRLLLIDIDGAALQRTVDEVLPDSELRRRVELVAWDVTGITRDFPALVRARIDGARSPEQAQDALLGLLHSYRLREPPMLFPRSSSPIDTVYSCMVLSQLATPLTQFVESQFGKRFGENSLLMGNPFQGALGEFTHRVQHSHIQALLASSPTFVLSSDVTERYTELDAHGSQRALPAELPLIGAQKLEELLPAHGAEVIAAEEWHWRFVEATRARPGSLMRVQGLVVRPSAG